MNDAEITKYFKTWYTSPISSTTTSTWLQSLLGDLTDIVGSDVASKLVSMLRAQYDYWEICDNDNLIFFNLLVNKIISYKDYYLELLTAYATQINFLDGRKTIISREGTGDGTNHGESTGSSTNQDYLLPNKNINEGLGNLSQQNVNNNSGESDGTSHSEYEDTETRTGDVDVVDAKKRYLDLIRNIYYEWAKKCEDCFIGLFY